MNDKPTADPAERQAGRIRFDVSLGPIARMFPASDWQAPQNTGGGAVFADRADEIVENVPREPEPGAAPAGTFNLDTHIHDQATGHPVPYLDVHADVAREDGTAVIDDLPLVPVARPHKGVAGLHYGNNISLDPTGRYRITIRIAAHPLIANDPITGDFTITFND